MLGPEDAPGPECVASVGLGRRAGPESVHRSGLDAGLEVGCWFEAVAEAV